MLQKQDNLIMWIIIGLFLFMGIRYLYNRYFSFIPKETLEYDDEIVQLLKKHGYVTLQRKIRVPIVIFVGEKEKLESRYFIDAIAKKDGLLYAVKVNRTKKPMMHTNTAIRDHLFPLYLLAPWDGVLHIDREQESITPYTFTYNSYRLPSSKRIIPFAIVFVLGILFTIIIR